MAYMLSFTVFAGSLPLLYYISWSPGGSSKSPGFQWNPNKQILPNLPNWVWIIHLFRGACTFEENAGCVSTPEVSTKFCIDPDEWLKRSRVRIFFCARKTEYFTNRNGSGWRCSVTDGKYMYFFSSNSKITSLFHKSKRAIKIAKCTFTGFDRNGNRGCVSFHWYAIITSVRLYQIYEYRRYIICFDIAMSLSQQFRPVKKLQ